MHSHDHMYHLHEVFGKLKKHNLKLHLGKCWFFHTQMEYLSQMIYLGGLGVQNVKVAYLCTLLGCSRNALHINMSTKDFRGVDIELKGHNALNIHDDAPIITYLQIGENLIRLTSKEWDCVMHRTKQFKLEGIFHFVNVDRWMSGGGDSPKEM